MIEIDVTVLISASLYLIYTHTHNTFFRFKKERPLVESPIYCHVQSWHCTLNSWHLPSCIGNSFFAVQSNRDLIIICSIPFTLPGLLHDSLSWTWPGALIWETTTVERSILEELEWHHKTKPKTPQIIHKQTKKGLKKKVWLNPS